MESLVITVINKVGLHARPAAQFVQTANKHKSQIRVINRTKKSEWCNAKSILSVLTLGVEKNHQIEITAEGPDELDAIVALKALVESNFGENIEGLDEPAS